MSVFASLPLSLTIGHLEKLTLLQTLWKHGVVTREIVVEALESAANDFQDFSDRFDNPEYPEQVQPVRDQLQKQANRYFDLARILREGGTLDEADR